MLIKFACHLYREHKVTLSDPASQNKADLPHADSALSWDWPFYLRLLFARPIAVLLVKFLLPTLPFLFETFDDVNGSAYVCFLVDGACS